MIAKQGQDPSKDSPGEVKEDSGSSGEGAVIERLRVRLRRERTKNNNLILAMLEARDALEMAREDYRQLERDAVDDHGATYFSGRVRKMDGAITTTYAAHENYGR